MNHRGRVTLMCVGDIHAGEVKWRLPVSIRSLATGADVVIVNVESPLTDDGAPLEQKKLHLRSAPESVQLLRELSTGVACIANNHICDWGREGLANTRRILREHDIAPVGAGLNLREAETPLTLERNGLVLGVLAFGSEEIQTIPAQSDRFGCAPLNPDRMRAAIEQLRARVDTVIVGVHWGYTNYHYPLPGHVALGRSLLDAGATLVVGHHPHVIQGFERRGQGAILYSLGNFIFAPFHRSGQLVSQTRENRTAMIARVEVEADGVRDIEFVHSRQLSEQTLVDVVSPGRAKRRQRFLCSLSKPLHRPGYAGFFKRYALRRIVYRAMRWLPPKRWRSFDRAYLQGVAVALRSILKR